MVPKCLVIIPDGNRRWARKNHRRDITGHTRGLFNCRSITRAAFERGVTHVVLWAASELNLYRRPPNEIMHIFRLLKHELRSRLKNPEEIGFHLCGDWRRFTQDQELFMLADEVQEKSARYTKQQLTVLFGYSGRAELVDAIKKLSASGDEITPETIRRHLWTSHLPDVDLVIRTGVQNDPHWSDWLLLWQCGNSQLYFSAKDWPAFGVEDLQAAFEDYARRPRREGA